jgi:methionyl-tRNA formyltransferase
MKQAINLKQSNRVTIFLMTEKGFVSLKAIANQYKHLIDLVVIGSDKAIKNDYTNEIIEYCLHSNIPYICRNDFKEVKSEFVLAISWRWIIHHPKDKLIIFHDSILPKYRGFAPLVNCLINGETEIGVSAILGAPEFDTGEIIAQSKLSIKYPLKINEAIKINNANYISCLMKVLNNLSLGIPLLAEIQNEVKATYSCWRDDDDYQIDWNRSAKFIKRFIDSVGFPYKGAVTTYDNKFLRIYDAEEVSDVFIENRDVGKVLFVKDGKPIVICGTGLLKITDASYENSTQDLSFFPLKKFRIRFR